MASFSKHDHKFSGYLKEGFFFY